MQTWIRLRTNLDRVDEVIHLIDLLKVEKPTVIGCLFLFWAHCDENCRQGRVTLNARQIDRLTMKGFTKALIKVGWLLGKDGDYVIPRFNRYNPSTSKDRIEELPDVDPAPRRGTYPVINDPRTGRFRKKGVPSPDSAIAEPASTPAHHASMLGAIADTDSTRETPEVTGRFRKKGVPSPDLAIAEPASTPADHASMHGAIADTDSTGETLGVAGELLVFAGDRAGTSNGEPAGEVAGELLVKSDQQKAAATRIPERGNHSPATEKRRSEKRRERNEGRIDHSPPNLEKVLDWATQGGIDEGFARLWFAAVAVNGFKDKAGLPIVNLRAYFKVSAASWQGRQTAPPNVIALPRPPTEPVPRQAWQVEKDLRSVEERLKKTSGGWRPNQDDIKVLSNEKKRLHRELIELLKLHTDEKCS